MSTDLRSILRNLCFNSAWKYAVFWKLQHHARMVLTWEEAYYDNSSQNKVLGNKLIAETALNFNGGNYSQDLLELTVAKMFYSVYSMGKGVVGQVAVSGKHRWIHAGDVDNSCSFEGWQNHFAAGIKTIAVIAVGQHGVIQLGSLEVVPEDEKLVAYVRDLFLAFWESSIRLATDFMDCSIMDRGYNPGKTSKARLEDVPQFACLPMPPCTVAPIDSQMYNIPFFNAYDAEAVEHGKMEPLRLRSHECARICVGDQSVDQKNENKVNDGLMKGETSGFGGLNEKQKHKRRTVPKVNDWVGKNKNVNDDESVAETNLIDSGSSYRLGSALSGASEVDGLVSYDSYEASQLDKTAGINFQKYSGRVKCQLQSSHMNALKSPRNFFAGYELLEALGPAFLQNNNCLSEEAEAYSQIPDDISNDQLGAEPRPENLLDAIVANVCHSSSSASRSEGSLSKSVQSLLTGERVFETASNRNHSIASSESWGELSSNAVSSPYLSKRSEQSRKSVDPPKTNKKRAKPGESCRPRPRDRQLIQDRIKELRELVPNGSKCSIDSLLERTINHMLFLQSVHKHAEKLSKCAELKAKGMRSEDHEEGSSWAVEVRGHHKVCSIMVESVSKHGQMVVEMLCEECSHFLEISEAIRSLGLSILKGVTEAHGDQTWMCFVVEGPNNKVIHRMDILWSLVQMFQPKTSS